ncbi:uncharacterized protein LOC62_05G006893 [Vanrija pseudolonga]|uniref:Uncharacterized protein n=1 Tax=Vanrija pseudolonga TaxID=143232 RepID=A0AAF1BNN8_9TREE|nr:hypothetical protein LOC62_05G006893 [Vanrija pseudolonga]
MGLFDFLPCCGKRAVAVKDDEVVAADTDPLLAPGSDSISNQDGYGAVAMSAAAPESSGGLNASQRARIAEIGREAGGHMLPITHASRAATTSPGVRRAATSGTASPASRPASPVPGVPTDSPVIPPSPLAETSGANDDDTPIASGATTPVHQPEAVAGSAEVVHKTLFASGAPPTRGGKSNGGNGGGGNGSGGGNRNGGNKGRGRGRGRGRSKKSK